MRVLSAVKLVFAPPWTMHRHHHQGFHELIVLSSGAIEAHLDTAGTVTVRAGESLLYERGVGHAERLAGRRPVQMVCIAFDVQEPGPLLSPDTEGRVRSLARWMSEMTSPLNEQDQRTQNALMVAMLAERMARAGGEETIVRIARRYITDHLAQPIALEDLAKAACLSKFHFARQFRAATGESPMAFLRRQRIEAARSMLATPGLPLRAIASMVGLGDEYHLSRVYKRVTGIPPRGLPAMRY